MNGQRAIKIYTCAILKADPNIQNDEERAYYNSIIKEMKEEEARASKEKRKVEWGIPPE